MIDMGSMPVDIWTLDVVEREAWRLWGSREVGLLFWYVNAMLDFPFGAIVGMLGI